MTKTTSYEISKKLKEAGFEAEADYNFIERNNQKAFLVNIKELSGIEIMNEIGVFIKAYDLETLIDALPSFIEHNNITYDLWVWNNGIGYYPNYDKYSGKEVYTMKNSHIGYFLVDKSLADTAGKMWLLLKEKGLIC